MMDYSQLKAMAKQIGVRMTSLLALAWNCALWAVGESALWSGSSSIRRSNIVDPSELYRVRMSVTVDNGSPYQGLPRGRD
jgi:hypothetical protein